MTPDDLFFMLLGAGMSFVGAVAVAVILRWRANAGSFWGQLTKGRDDAD